MPAKRLEPTARLFDPDKKAQLAYTPANATDIGKRFAAIRRAQAKAERLASAGPAATPRARRKPETAIDNPAQLRLVG